MAKHVAFVRKRRTAAKATATQKSAAKEAEVYPRQATYHWMKKLDDALDASWSSPVHEYVPLERAWDGFCPQELRAMAALTSLPDIPNERNMLPSQTCQGLLMCYKCLGDAHTCFAIVVRAVRYIQIEVICIDNIYRAIQRCVSQTQLES